MLNKKQERIDDLNRGGLRIIQNSSAPCFSVDAVLLSDFVQLKKNDRIIDLGTGTGIIPLLLYAKQNSCSIVGLEIMPEMAELALKSIELNNIQGNIDIVCGDIRESVSIFGKSNADVITVNPPYYVPGKGHACEDHLFAVARSEIYCPLEILLQQAATLLKPLGRFYAVHRANRMSDMIEGLRKNNLEPVKLRMIHPFAVENANLFLIEARKNCKSELKICPPLIVYGEPQQYSQEMAEIYKGRGCGI